MDRCEAVEKETGAGVKGTDYSSRATGWKNAAPEKLEA